MIKPGANAPGFIVYAILFYAYDISASATRYIALPIAAATAASVKAFMDYETAFTGVRKTVDGTDEELQAVSDGLEEMALRIPVASVELANIAKIGGQLGVPTKSLLEFTEAFAGLEVSTNLQGEEGASTLARFMNVVNEDFGNIQNVGSAIVDLGNHYATTEAEITEMAMRLGSTGAIVGMSTSDILGYSAALSSLGIQAEMGGSAMTRIWQDIAMRVSSGGTALENYAKVSKMTAADFVKAWKDDPAKAFNSILKGLNESSDVLGDISSLSIKNVRDVQSMQKLAGRYDLVTEALNRSSTAYRENTALAEEANRAYGTTASKLQLAKESIVQAGRSIGEALAPTVVDLAGGVQDATQGFADLDKGAQQTIVKGALLTAGVITGTNVIGKFAQNVATVGKGFIKLKSLATPLIKTTFPGLTKVAGASAVKGVSILGAALPKVAVGLAAVAAVTAKVAYDKWYKQNYLWADDFSEQSAKLQAASKDYTRLIELKEEYAQAKAIIASPVATTEEIDVAKSKIEEIKQLLEDEYNLKITSDTEDLDNAFQMLTARQRYNIMDEGNQAISDMHNAAEGYKKSQNKVNEYDSKMSDLQNKAAVLSNIRLEAEKVGDAWEHDAISQKEYLKQLNALSQQINSAGYTDAPIFNTSDSLLMWLNSAESALDGEMKSVSEKYQEIVDQREKFKASIESSNESFSSLLANDLRNGNWENANYDTSKLYEIGRTVKDAGLSTDELAKSFAAAKQGFADFDEAISAGAASAMADEFIEYKKSIGDFVGSEDAVIQQAALIRNGFSEVTPALQQSEDGIKAVIKDIQSLGQEQGINYSVAQLTDMAHAMNLIPDNKHIEFDVDTGQILVIYNLDEKIKSFNNISGTEIKLKINIDGSIGVLDTVDTKLKELIAQGADIRVNFNTETGTGDLFNGNTKIGTVTAEGKIEWEDTSPPTVPDANANVNFGVGSSPTTVPNASGTADFGLGQHPTSTPDVSGQANYKGVFPTSAPKLFGTIIYTAKTIGTKIKNAITGGVGVDGTAHVHGTAYSTGTAAKHGRAFKNGDWGTKSDGIALGGELGEELVNE